MTRGKCQIKKKKNQLLLQSIFGPLRNTATLQVKSNVPSSEPYLLKIKRHFILQTPEFTTHNSFFQNSLFLLIISNSAR